MIKKAYLKTTIFWSISSPNVFSLVTLCVEAFKCLLRGGLYCEFGVKRLLADSEPEHEGKPHVKRDGRWKRTRKVTFEKIKCGNHGMLEKGGRR